MAHSESNAPHVGVLKSRSPLMTAKQVAAMVAVHPNLIYLALADEHLRGYRVGRGPKPPWRIRVEDVETWLVAATSVAA